MAANDFVSRKFRAPGYAEGRGEVAPASLNLASLDDSAGSRTLGDSFASVTSSQFPQSPGKRKTSLVSKASVRTSAAGRLPTKSHRPGRGGGTEHKERYFKDRTIITKELAKLAAAENATWAPYAMLRPALPETALFSYVKPKKRLDDAASTAGDAQAAALTDKRALPPSEPAHAPAASASNDHLLLLHNNNNNNKNNNLNEAALQRAGGSFSSAASLGQSNSNGNNNGNNGNNNGNNNNNNNNNVNSMSSNASAGRHGSFKLVDGKLARASWAEEPRASWAEEPPQAEEWELDPMVNREGKFDLGLDDPKYIASPTWTRCGCLRQLGVLADPGDEEVINAGIKSLQDTEAVVRAAALHLLHTLADKPDHRLLKPIMQMTKDRDANVRTAACQTLQTLADPGMTPSRAHPATGTSEDILLLKRDQNVIHALTPLLDDDFGHVRAAAANALDKVNAGWQSFKLTEEKRDDTRKSPRSRRPLESNKVLGSLQPIARIWDRKYTYDDILPELSHKGEGREGGVHVAGKVRGHDQRYLTLAGYKYRSYNDALRQERMVARFELEQQKAATKIQLQRQMKPSTEGRKITTEWMGIEWTDRSRRSHLGKTLHAFGAGVEPARDSVAAPYNQGYNGFAVPLGYSYI